VWHLVSRRRSHRASSFYSAGSLTSRAALLKNIPHCRCTLKLRVSNDVTISSFSWCMTFCLPGESQNKEGHRSTKKVG
jgi:hypothetical protein